MPGGARDYVWRHFLSEKTLQMMGDMRQQFLQLLQGIGFTETPGGGRGRRTGDPAFDDNSEDLTLVKAVLCSGLYPNVVTVKNAKRRAKLMTEEDGKVECHPSSVNASVSQFTTNFLVYSEKVKTSSIFIRNSTMVSDYALLLFGGALRPGPEPGTFTMGRGNLVFTAGQGVATLVQELRARLDALLERKIATPTMDLVREGGGIVKAVRALLAEPAQVGAHPHDSRHPDGDRAYHG
ncbi:hypothetical protein CYMTET_50331 [Cymbomonas tetramitiformis]|uniref:Uncharacterized protein n=1 Tax=Cymbomonas tetramitiformis TaxID=36881 RepID=A0AAE0BNE2_9CHLO|nr:hypothetical protein CYMTET_50331 [Cymbomonas tetramitiformis]